ncbi:hypothetical protein GEMRC1_011619 [Eukaryota sp. GEM-RC1]
MAHFTFFPQALPEDLMLDSASTISPTPGSYSDTQTSQSLQRKLDPTSSVHIMITFSSDHDGHFTTTSHSMGSKASTRPINQIQLYSSSFQDWVLDFGKDYVSPVLLVVNLRVVDSSFVIF